MRKACAWLSKAVSNTSVREVMHKGRATAMLPASISCVCLPSAFTECSLAEQQSSIWQPALALQYCRLKFHEDGGLGLGLALDGDKMRRHPGPVTS